MDPAARSGIRCTPEEVPVYHSADNRTWRGARNPTHWRQTMEWLRRAAAPLSPRVCEDVDDLTGTMFKQTVVARRIVDFEGPRGWNHVATQLGTFKPVPVPRDLGKVQVSTPDVMLLTELRADFDIPWT